MPVPLSDRAARWRAALAPVTGMWVASGSPVCAEICAGAGFDWLLVDSEHAPNDLRSILAQLQAVAAYPVTPVIRPPSGDPVLIKQLLDVGVEVLLIPMVESRAQARALVAATRYPPEGIRGVGSALARASRWNRVEGYLARAAETVSVLVQVESRAGLDAIKAITAAGKPVGVNAFPPNLAARYLRAGARFILVGADVTLLARGSEQLAARHRPEKD
jgi:4-hydroxy-2-oxoheptanedioate aldolase